MKKGIIIAVIAVLVVGGGAFALMHNNSKTTSSTTPASSTSNAPNQPANTDQSASSATPANGSSSSTPASGATDTFAISANDTSASPSTINVKKGDTVRLTFNVMNQGTYHGGLDFKSTDPALDSGSIDAGESGTMTFTATKSFQFTPYWYKSGVKKDYMVSVNVQ